MADPDVMADPDILDPEDGPQDSSVPPVAPALLTLAGAIPGADLLATPESAIQIGLDFLSFDGISRALRLSGWTIDSEVARLADLARDHPDPTVSFAAIKLLRDHLREAAALSGLTQQLTAARSYQDPGGLRVTAQVQATRLSAGVSGLRTDTERMLAAAASIPNVVYASPPGGEPEDSQPQPQPQVLPPTPLRGENDQRASSERPANDQRTTLILSKEDDHGQSDPAPPPPDPAVRERHSGDPGPPADPGTPH